MGISTAFNQAAANPLAPPYRNPPPRPIPTTRVITTPVDAKKLRAKKDDKTGGKPGGNGAK